MKKIVISTILILVLFITNINNAKAIDDACDEQEYAIYKKLAE